LDKFLPPNDEGYLTKFFSLKQKVFSYQHIDLILKTLEENTLEAAIERTYLVTNVNSVKTAMLLLEFLQRIFDTYLITEFRVEAL
jgi:hypothetical protein